MLRYRLSHLIVALVFCLTYAGVIFLLTPASLWRTPSILSASISVVLLFLLIAGPVNSNPSGRRSDASTIASIGINFGLMGFSFLISLAALLLTLNRHDRLGEASLLIAVGSGIASIIVMGIALSLIGEKSSDRPKNEGGH